MIRTGLASITFRRFPTQEIIRLAAESRLKFIEWAGEIHVPPGDMDNAREVGERTRDAGIGIAAYGSYYRVGEPQPDYDAFDRVIETAVALEAPVVRIWAGTKGSKQASDHHWERAIREARNIAEKAKQAHLKLAFEFHGHTLNDRPSGTTRLMEGVDHANIGTLWQLDGSLVTEEVSVAARSIRRVLDWLVNIHVFYWHEGLRRPLEEGHKFWEAFFEAAASTKREHIALLKFVQDDSPLTLFKDAKTLHELVKDANRRAKLKAREAGGGPQKRASRRSP